MNLEKITFASDALLLPKMLHLCYRKCCTTVTKNAAL